MADETSTPQASPAAKPRKGTERLVARLHTAGAGDSFRVGDFELTHEGIEVSAEQADELIEIAMANGVSVSVERVQEGDDK
jgi:hypothetical protein